MFVCLFVGLLFWWCCFIFVFVSVCVRFFRFFSLHFHLLGVVVVVVVFILAHFFCYLLARSLSITLPFHLVFSVYIIWFALLFVGFAWTLSWNIYSTHWYYYYTHFDCCSLLRRLMQTQTHTYPSCAGFLCTVFGRWWLYIPPWIQRNAECIHFCTGPMTT